MLDKIHKAGLSLKGGEERNGFAAAYRNRSCRCSRELRLRINVDHANGRDDVEWTIVGVVGNTRSTLDGPVRQTIFIPTPQRPTYALTFFVRSQQDSTSLALAISAIEQPASRLGRMTVWPGAERMSALSAMK